MVKSVLAFTLIIALGIGLCIILYPAHARNDAKPTPEACADTAPASLKEANDIVVSQMQKMTEMSADLAKAHAYGLEKFNECAVLKAENERMRSIRPEIDPYDTMKPSIQQAHKLLEAAFTHISALWLNASMDREWEDRDDLQSIWEDMDNARLKLKKMMKKQQIVEKK